MFNLNKVNKANLFYVKLNSIPINKIYSSFYYSSQIPYVIYSENVVSFRLNHFMFVF